MSELSAIYMIFHDSGRHSPVDYGSQNSHRNHDYHYEDQCITSKSHSDMTSNHGNNCHNDWLFTTGRHNAQISQAIPPDRFLSRSHLIEAAFCPAALKADGEWGKVPAKNFSMLGRLGTQNIIDRKIRFLPVIVAHIYKVQIKPADSGDI